MKFISTAAFEAYENLPTVEVDIAVNRSFQNYLTPEGYYATCQLSELTT